MLSIDDIKEEFLNNNYFQCGMDDNDNVGIQLELNPETKIGMKCDVIFEGEHYDDEIACSPEVGIFDTAEKFWDNVAEEVECWFNMCKDNNG